MAEAEMKALYERLKDVNPSAAAAIVAIPRYAHFVEAPKKEKTKKSED